MNDAFRKRLLALLIPALFSTGGAFAGEEEQVLQLLPLSLEELFATKVMTASRRMEAREQTPAHILVYTREQIRERRYNNLADLLEDLPGVDFQRGTRSSQYNYFSFQGQISNVKLIILLDGVRIDNPVGGSIPIAENFSLFHAKQVEVLYGPAAALYGADAMAGVINIITERPEGKPTATVKYSGGSFDTQEGSLLASTPVGDESGLTVGVNRQRSARASLDQYYPGQFPKVDAKTFSGVTAIPAAKREDYTGGPTGGESDYLRLDVGKQLTFGYYRNLFHSLTSTGDTSKNAVYSPDVQIRNEIQTFYGKARFNWTPNLSGELLIDHSEWEVDPQSRYYNIYTDFRDVGYLYSAGRRRGIEQTVTWQADENHVIQAGAGFKDYHAVVSPNLPSPYVSGQQYVYPSTTLPITITSMDYSNQSAYAQWQAQWTPVLSTTAGVRYDHHSVYGGSTNPRVGLVWQNQPGSFIKLLYGEAFRAPSPDEFLNAYGTFSGAKQGDLYVGSNFRATNLNLKPEKARELSLTWDWRPRNDFNLVANAYVTRVTDVIVTQNDATPIQYIPGALLTSTSMKANNGVDRYYGLDIAPQWRVPLGGGWNADLWGSYSYTQGTIQEASGGVEWDQSLIATHKAKLGATFRQRDWLTITARVQGTGPVTTGRKIGNSGDRIEAPGYAVASLHFGFHKLADRKLSAYVDIYNLFDRRYYAAHGSASTTFVQVPQPPRSLGVSLEYKF